MAIIPSFFESEVKKDIRERQRFLMHFISLSRHQGTRLFVNTQGLGQYKDSRKKSSDSQGETQLGKLSCCESNSSACIANPATCSSVNKLVQCRSINGLGACTRTDSTAQVVCQHTDGIYCLGGNTDRFYNKSSSSLTEKESGSAVTCSDSLASGNCQIENGVGGTFPFDYQVEICGPGYDNIIVAQPSNVPVSTLKIPPTGSSNRTPGSTDGSDNSTSDSIGGPVIIVQQPAVNQPQPEEIMMETFNNGEGGSSNPLPSYTSKQKGKNLGYLQPLTKLELLNVVNTELISGLEYLPAGFAAETLNRIPSSKGSLDTNRYDYQSWRKKYDHGLSNAQKWLNKEYPEYGKCLGEFDKVNKGKKREEITELDISHNTLNRIKDIKLEGRLSLTGFVNLKKFDCYGNKITALDLSSCIQLEEVNCSKQFVLGNLNLSELNKLTKLDCSGNYSLTELNLSDCSELTYLKCCDDKISKITIADPKKLVYLDISTNDLPAQDLTFFKEFTNLEELDISRNRWCGTLEPLKNCVKLVRLDISGTDLYEGIEYLPISLEKFELKRISNENDLVNGELIGEIKSERIIFVDNPTLPFININDDEEEKEEKENEIKINKRKREKSRKKLLEYLGKNCNEVYKPNNLGNLKDKIKEISRSKVVPGGTFNETHYHAKEASTTNIGRNTDYSRSTLNFSGEGSQNIVGISDLGLHNHPAEKNLVETENSFSEISKTTKIFNIKENNMTEPNNNNSNLITNEQPSLTTSSVDTREGNLNMGNQVKGNNANLSSNRRSTEYSGHFHFTGSKSQNVLGNDNKLTQNNNEVDNEGKVVVARLKRETLVKDAMTKLAQDLDSIKILFEILPTVKEKVKQEVDMQKNRSCSPNIKIGGNITTQQGNSNIGNIAEDNADFSCNITPQTENISYQPSASVNQDQQINQEEKGLTSTEEIKKDKPS
ncbi:6986_t:CDS:10 [Racocetra persica]|uniref:6986_t:CDS:1 n=1 Tax=Racocetra persica TaxID=160502 RepID=A0ACA9KAJ1_9GLOM|nr:6986_t:CDS:10 [Racocetra persica]